MVRGRGLRIGIFFCTDWLFLEDFWYFSRAFHTAVQSVQQYTWSSKRKRHLRHHGKIGSCLLTRDKKWVRQFYTVYRGLNLIPNSFSVFRPTSEFMESIWNTLTDAHVRFFSQKKPITYVGSECKPVCSGRQKKNVFTSLTEFQIKIPH